MFLLAIIYSFFPTSKETGIVSTTKQNTSVYTERVKAANFLSGQLQAHFLKHGYQFGEITELDYLEDARKLLDASPDGDVLEKIRDNGDIEHYRESTHEFAVMTKMGCIRTFFKANNAYWDRQ